MAGLLLHMLEHGFQPNYYPNRKFHPLGSMLVIVLSQNFFSDTYKN